MAAAQVGRGQKDLHHFDRGLAGDDAATEGKDVGVVVFAREAGGVYVMRERRANAGNFVGRDGNANARAANGDAKIGVFRNHMFGHGFAIVGIVHGFFGGSPQIADYVACTLQMLANDFFDGKSGVIGTDGDARLGGYVAHES